MIVTCASCLTKFNLEESRIPAKGAKVRCSRCKHVFFIVPPERPKEEVVEDFESFAKAHEKLVEPQEKGPPPPPTFEPEKGFAPEEFEKEEEERAEEGFALEEKPPPRPIRRVEPRIGREGERARPRVVRPERAESKKKRSPSLFFALVVILLVLIFGAFYLWTELESGGKLSPYLDTLLKKITDLWDRIWGIGKEDLIFKGLNRYKEKIEEAPLLLGGFGS